MFLTISKVYILKKLFCIFFTGFVIKIMDDYLDQDIDNLEKKQNLFAAIEYGGLSYALLLLSLAFMLDPVTSLSLFFASFAVGMAGNLTVKMPLGLYGYQESIIVVLLGFIFFKINMTSSLLIIVTIQLWDDFLDYDKDRINKKNLAFLLGKVECLLLAIIFFLLSFYLDYIKAVSSIILMHVIIYIINILLTKQKNNESNSLEGKVKDVL